MRFNRIAYRESFDSDLDVRAGLHDVFIPNGDKSYSAEAGMHRPEGGNPPRQIAPLLLVKWESAAAEITKSGIGSSRRVRASELALDALSALQNCIMVILNLYDKLFCNHVRIKQHFSKYAQFIWLRALTEQTMFSEAMWTTQKKTAADVSEFIRVDNLFTI